MTGVTLTKEQAERVPLWRNARCPMVTAPSVLGLPDGMIIDDAFIDQWFKAIEGIRGKDDA